MGNYYSGTNNNMSNMQSNIASKRMHNNFLDHLEKTNNFQMISNSSKKRNKSNTKSYNNNDQFENPVDISSYLSHLNYSNLAGPIQGPQATNKSMVLDSANFSHHNSVGKNYDNSFTSGGAAGLASAKGGP